MNVTKRIEISPTGNRKMVIRMNKKETGLHNYLYDVNYN